MQQGGFHEGIRNEKIGEVGVVEKDRPTCGPLDAILRPTKGLICTSDVHTAHGAVGERKNLTMGHEVVGVVEDVGAAEKGIATGLCPGGHLRLSRLLRLLATGRIDPTPLTTHTFGFDEIEKAFHMMEKKEDGMIEPLIEFEA